MRSYFYIILFCIVASSCFNHGKINVREHDHKEEIVQYRYETSDKSIITIGSFAPNICLPSVINPNEFISIPKGDTCLVMFWASWCPDCEMAMSYLKVFLSIHNDVKLLTVSLDADYKEAQKAIKKENINGQHLYDKASWRSEVARAYNIKEIPQFFLIGPDTRIIEMGPQVEKLLHKSTENR